jgi:cytochrome c-type biogenesis protein CcmH/NrfF
MQAEIVCMCGTCGRQRLNECQCPTAGKMREELAGLVAAGKSRDEILQYHIAKYGSEEPLAAPIDKGFNRLAWLVPYLAGASGAIAIGLAAVRWSRHSADRPDISPESDPGIEDRLDDELRNLD